MEVVQLLLKAKKQKMDNYDSCRGPSFVRSKAFQAEIYQMEGERDDADLSAPEERLARCERKKNVLRV